MNWGVWYDGFHWTIYNEDVADLFTGATFNVLIASDVIIGTPEIPQETARINVFPNPAKDKVGILLNKKLAAENVIFRLTSTDGRTMIEQSASGDSNGKFSLDVRTLAPGLYFLSASTSEGIISSKVNIIK